MHSASIASPTRFNIIVLAFANFSLEQRDATASTVLLEGCKSRIGGHYPMGRTEGMSNGRLLLVSPLGPLTCGHSTAVHVQWSFCKADHGLESKQAFLLPGFPAWASGRRRRPRCMLWPLAVAGAAPACVAAAATALPPMPPDPTNAATSRQQQGQQQTACSITGCYWGWCWPAVCYLPQAYCTQSQGVPRLSNSGGWVSARLVGLKNSAHL